MSHTIGFQNKKLAVPDQPEIPYIEGDGIGPDIWETTRKVVDASVEKVYGKNKKIQWVEVFAGEKALKQYNTYLPDETLRIFREKRVGLKGPLGTPTGGGLRSLNVALRQELDLFACVRPVRHFKGVPSPVRHPEKVDMVIFRENTEDVYMGIEFEANSDKAVKLAEFLNKELGVARISSSKDVSIGIKPITENGSKRLVRSAIEYALEHKRQSITLVHKGNIMKFTEGFFLKWGYEVATREYGATLSEDGTHHIKAPHGTVKVKDVIADNFLQQILLRPEEYDVVATMNLNGDYISDALAAQVGGIGIAPGGNINYETGHAIFEATHGTAPKYAGKKIANPSSLLLSASMLLEYIGWKEASVCLEKALEEAISSGCVTLDFANLMTGVSPLSTPEFGEAILCRL